MKNKPLRHKEQNTFKFEPFTQRIANIKVDVFHKVSHKYERDEEEDDTHFHQTLEKWALLNLSEPFENLRQELGSELKILPQLIKRKDAIVPILIKHLQNKDRLNLQCVLELVVSLAKDIRNDFHPYFLVTFRQMIPLIESKNPELMEWTFQALAYLFKFLWRYLLSNLNEVFETLVPLLSSRKPWYINNFAAQSFAFVARKVKDPSKLVKLVLRSLKKFPDGAEGCGRLFFEIIKGVPGQFHSCAETVLNAFLDSLDDSSSSRSFVVISSCFASVFKEIRSEHIELLWRVLLSKMDKCYACWESNGHSNSADAIKKVLQLLRQAVEYKMAVLVLNPDILVGHILTLIEGKYVAQWFDEIIDICASILLSPSLKLSQELSSKIVNACMGHLKGNDLLSFVNKTKSYFGFESLILPQFLQFCSLNPPLTMLHHLSSLILDKRPFPLDSDAYTSWTPYALTLSTNDESEPEKFANAYLQFLDDCDVTESSDIDKCANALIVLPNVRPIDNKKAVSVVVKLAHKICNELNSSGSERDIVNYLASLLPIVIDTTIKLKPENGISSVLSTEVVLKILLKYSSADRPDVLRALDSYVTFDELETLNPHHDEVRKRVLPMIGSPYHKVRLFACHILWKCELSSSNEGLLADIFGLIYMAEKISPTIADYREKIKILQKVSCKTPSIHDAVTKGIVDGKILLRYFLGSLFLNFKLVWEPLSSFVVSYSQAMTPSEFWEVFHNYYNDVVHNINDQFEQTSTSPFKDARLSTMVQSHRNLDERPDYINCRILMLKILEECVPICEMKNKDLVTLFLNFLNNEYYKKNADAAFSWDITNKTDDATNLTLEPMDVSANDEDSKLNGTTENDVNSDEIIESEDAEFKQEINGVEPEFDNKRWITKSLLAHLSVFGKLRSPKSIHKDRELLNIYQEFLSHKLSDVQKAALDCIMAYKFKYLTPYSEHLYGLLDDKNFKKEVSLFRIDTESDVVKSEHRPELIPLVMRIVYSKMYAKSTATKGANKQARKATVIRFLAGCSKLEMESFFRMAFSIFHEYATSDDLLKKLDDLTLQVNLKAVIPPRRLQSAIYLLNTVLVYCGGLLGPEQLSYLLRIALVSMAHLNGIFQNRENVFPGYIKTLRNIRNTCFEVLTKFYKRFDSYSWTCNETEAVFKVFVWPYLSKLPIEGIYSPTAQLRLFIAWSRNSRYFVLLGKTCDEGKHLSAIDAIMELWLSEKTHGSVSAAIMELVESLLITEDFKETTNEGLIGNSEVKSLEVLQSASLDKFQDLLQANPELNYGSKLLIPFVPTILEQLKRKLESKKGLEKRGREIMSRVTELVTDAQSSEVVLELLLPSLIKKAESSDDVISPLLTTVYNLIKIVAHPGRYVRKLAPLFGSVSSPSARKLLFSIVVALSKLEGSESDLDGQLLDDLNAWDSKWVDQPDFTKRLSAFKKLEDLSEGNLPINLGVIGIFTCFYFVRSEKDASLRDNAKHCLEKMCICLVRKIGDDPKEKNYLLDNIILGQIRRGFAAKQTDNVRNDSISLLGHLTRNCSDLHPVLKDLSHLANKQDLEVDFFENLMHLQLHRRVRAMLKVSTVLSDLEKPPVTRTLTQFILPMISHYLLSERYYNKNTIVHSAITALGSICSYLPWHQYQTVLKYYLAKLQGGVDYQKQTVRILVDILNAFHFNLSKADLSLSLEIRGVLPNGQDANQNGQPEAATDLAVKDSEEDNLNIENLLEGDQEAEPEIVKKEGKTEIILSAGAATKVIEMIIKEILPKLNQVMSQKTTAETHHKLSRKMTGPDSDEEDILKVPIAVAAVKLLQKLPSKQFIDINLPGILLKLCTFLKSRLESVRRVTRETLQTIMVSLGPDYLPILVTEMKSLLTRGYQVHVLVYSIHSVLVPLEPHFQKGQLDKCAQPVIDICRMDLFGRASEEKEVNQIVGKVLEARVTRSYDIFKILSKYLTEQYLLDLLIPLKEELSRTMSHKYINKVRLTLEQVVLGLTENAYLTPEALLLFAYGTSSESIPALIVDIKDKPVDIKKAELQARREPDSFLIPAEPKRSKVVEGVNTCARTNAHILAEFGLRLLYFLLKREKVKEKMYIAHLDPFVGLLKNSLNSEHIKIGSLAVKCLSWMVKMELPSIKINIQKLSEALFAILHKYACAGLSKGDNFDLVMATFNAVANIVRDVKYHQLSSEQMRTLILYCEQDIEDTSRQATAFSLLKALISCKVSSPELISVVEKVAVVSIKAYEPSVRHQARQIVHNYLMHYSLGKHIEKFLAVYYNELNYEHLAGRKSALEMIQTVTNTFPMERLVQQAPIIFINVSTVLINDNDSSCRQTAADVLTALLSRLDNNSKNKLFDITEIWFTQKKLTHRKLAAQMLGLFVACEKEAFKSRLKNLMPLIVESFISSGEESRNGRFVKAPKVAEEQEDTSKEDRDKDHYLFQLLQSLVKIATHCPAFLQEETFVADLETIADHATNLLGHPHQWVRHSAIQLIGLVITTYKPADVASIANGVSKEKPGFLLTDTKSRLKSLAHDVIAQLMPSEEINENFLMQCMKLLTYLAEIIKDVQPTDDCKLSLLWMVRMVQKMINYEVVNAPSSSIVRRMAFNWLAAISLKLSRDELSGVAFQLLKPIARQLNVEENDDLKKLAREASNYIKKKIGTDLYNETMAKLSQLMDIRKAERKKQRTQMMVTDPARAAKRKIDKNLKKKESKKKKIKMMKTKTYKKKKRKDPFMDD